MTYVGGRSFARDNFDMLQAGKRPPGTALLPFLYASAFNTGYNPCMRLIDDAMDNRLVGIGGSEGILGEWGMELNKGSYLDSVTLRQALAWSKISSSARLGMQIGAKTFMQNLEQFGLTPPARNPNSTEANPTYYPRVYLGTEPTSLKELVLAYTSFPNLGKRPVKTHVITKVTDSNGKVLWENPLAKETNCVESCPPSTAFRIHDILKQGLDDGSALRVKPYFPEGFKGAVKTGTNYDFADNTLIAYHSSITAGVWVGFLNASYAIYPCAFSSDTCGPIMGALFQAADGVYKDEKIVPPSDTETVEICKKSGQVATEFCFEPVLKDGKPSYERQTYLEYFPKGDLSLPRCTLHGDGVPSLGDFLGNSIGTSRVLPIVPILPKQAALVGEDPYYSELVLNPRHKDGAGLASDSSALQQPIDAAKFSNEEQGDLLRSKKSQLELNPPALIQIPSLPIDIP